MSNDAALRQSFNYVDAIAEKDISRVDGINRNAAFAHVCSDPMLAIKVNKYQSPLLPQT